MPIPTTPQIDELVESLYQSGEFESRTAVIDRALRLLQRRRDMVQLIDVGIQQLDAGEFTEYSEDDRDRFIADIIAHSRLRLTGEAG